MKRTQTNLTQYSLIDKELELKLSNLILVGEERQLNRLIVTELLRQNPPRISITQVMTITMKMTDSRLISKSMNQRNQLLILRMT